MPEQKRGTGRILHERDVERAQTDALAGAMIRQAGASIEISNKRIVSSSSEGDIRLEDGTIIRTGGFEVIPPQSSPMSFTEAALAENAFQAQERDQAEGPDPIVEHGRELMRGADERQRRAAGELTGEDEGTQ